MRAQATTLCCIKKTKTKIVLVSLASILISSCFRTHKYELTWKVCDSNLFVEVYEVNSFGLKAQYLTDSLNFKKYIGDWDDEHEHYSYTCIGDSVYIMKTIRGNRWAEWDTAANGIISLKANLDTLENWKLSISKLATLNNFK